ncbi:MAG: hypothetical protein V3V61_00830 [Gammaproteobacteria bacterium]
MKINIQTAYEQTPEEIQYKDVTTELGKGAQRVRQAMAKHLLVRGNLSMEKISHLTDLSIEAVTTLEEDIAVLF